jgi:xenotropic and polytropic retrovirus receptor 1
MKFAKELEQDLVPGKTAETRVTITWKAADDSEWRAKYLDYKAGKKRVKAIVKAINRANNTPTSLARRADRPTPPSALAIGAPFAFASRPRAPSERPAVENGVDPIHRPRQDASQSVVAPTPARTHSELDRLTGVSSHGIQYGSFVPTPPASPVGDSTRNVFELPGPALRTPSESPARPNDSLHQSLSRSILSRSMSMVMGSSGTGTPVRDSKGKEADAGVPPERSGASAAGAGGQTPSTVRPGATPRTPGSLRRMFTNLTGREHESPIAAAVAMHNLNAVWERDQELFEFMKSELDKVERFYRAKEEHAERRLALLREQLHEMRNRRIQEMNAARARKEEEADAHDHGVMGVMGHPGKHLWTKPLRSAGLLKPGRNSEALRNMAQTPLFHSQNADARRDYIRRQSSHDIPYRTAKRKLKLALQELYRSLELLKAYALLNRTAFRKLNKKYDKAVLARPPYRFMNEKVSKAHFVTSDVLDAYIATVEDLYARYFEKGNRKVAVGKLRSLARRVGDESASAFRNGIFIGSGVIFCIQGLYLAGHLLRDPDEALRVRTAYLLQIYGGYFLMLFLFMLFCVDCYIWNRHKINYPFIFEFDTRHNLDWRQLSEFPSFFLCLFGCILWLNFSQYGGEKLYLYYPVILIGLTAVLVLLPAPVLRYHSRKWFAYSHYRLLLAGIYPVEFRDFFLGDIYCSLTYATCNIELLFCLYARHWENPPVCNSKHSRLLGFLGTLPPIWRFLQCIRRYNDTKNIFPHLVNCGKYLMTILAAALLSVYRISPAHHTQAVFILFASINAVYCSIWDLFMDFSLLQPHASKRFLRDITSLKKPFIYYIIMVVDVVLRFAWVFYVVFTHDPQHSSLASFFISFAEVSRRGMWALVRVENEHCANVAQYKASRDVPLPYDIEPAEVMEEASPLIGPPADEVPSQPAAERLEDGQVPGPGGTPRTFSKMLANAHKQDFEKKRRMSEQEEMELERDDDDDDDDEGDVSDREEVMSDQS